MTPDPQICLDFRRSQSAATIMSIEIAPLGDSALIVRVVAAVADRGPGTASPATADLSEETLNAVLQAQRCLENARLPGVIETAPAYTTVAVFFNPMQAIESGAPAENIFDWLAQKIRESLESVAAVADRGPGTAAEDSHHSKTVEVPVCYETEFAPDVDEVARHAGISTAEVVDLHCDANYRVHCLGFTPGFPFLGGLPDKLATPRRAVPRKEIPAGSVAIGGIQTGIYPIKSPGGWNVIGRTPLRLFDPEKNPPALLRAGDRVRFRAITREEFEATKP
jgi:inhibitor of KinA